jgi:hypothetical protein
VNSPKTLTKLVKYTLEKTFNFSKKIIGHKQFCCLQKWNYCCDGGNNIMIKNILIVGTMVTKKIPNKIYLKNNLQYLQKRKFT